MALKSPMDHAEWVYAVKENYKDLVDKSFHCRVCANPRTRIYFRCFACCAPRPAEILSEREAASIFAEYLYWVEPQNAARVLPGLTTFRKTDICDNIATYAELLSKKIAEIKADQSTPPSKNTNCRFCGTQLPAGRASSRCDKCEVRESGPSAVAKLPEYQKKHPVPYTDDMSGDDICQDIRVRL